MADMDGLFVARRPGAGGAARRPQGGSAAIRGTGAGGALQGLSRDMAQQIMEEMAREIVLDEAPDAENVSPDERRLRRSTSSRSGESRDQDCRGGDFFGDTAPDTARSAASSSGFAGGFGPSSSSTAPAPPAVDLLFARPSSGGGGGGGGANPGRSDGGNAGGSGGGGLMDSFFTKASPPTTGAVGARAGAGAESGAAADALFARPAGVPPLSLPHAGGGGGGALADGIFARPQGFSDSGTGSGVGCAMDGFFVRPGGGASSASLDSEDLDSEDEVEDAEEADEERPQRKAPSGGGETGKDGQDLEAAGAGAGAGARAGAGRSVSSLFGPYEAMRCSPACRRAALSRWTFAALGLALLLALLTAGLATGCDEQPLLGRFCVVPGGGAAQLALAFAPLVLALVASAWRLRRSYEAHRRRAEEAWRHDGQAQRGALGVLEALAEAPEGERLRYAKQVVQIMKDFPAKGAIQQKGCAAIESICRAQRGNPAQVRRAGAIPVVLAALEAHPRVRSVQRSGLAAVACLARVSAGQVFELGGVQTLLASIVKFKRDPAAQVAGALALGGLCAGSAHCRRSVLRYGGPDLLAQALARHYSNAEVLVAASETLVLMLKGDAGLQKQLLPALPLAQDLVARCEDPSWSQGAAAVAAPGARHREVALKSLRKLEALLRGASDGDPAGAAGGAAVGSTSSLGSEPEGGGSMAAAARRRAAAAAAAAGLTLGGGGGSGEVDSELGSEAGTPRQEPTKLADRQDQELQDRFKKWGEHKKKGSRSAPTSSSSAAARSRAGG